MLRLIGVIVFSQLGAVAYVGEVFWLFVVCALLVGVLVAQISIDLDKTKQQNLSKGDAT